MDRMRAKRSFPTEDVSDQSIQDPFWQIPIDIMSKRILPLLTVHDLYKNVSLVSKRASALARATTSRVSPPAHFESIESFHKTMDIAWDRGCASLPFQVSLRIPSPGPWDCKTYRMMLKIFDIVEVSLHSLEKCEVACFGRVPEVEVVDCQSDTSLSLSHTDTISVIRCPNILTLHAPRARSVEITGCHSFVALSGNGCVTTLDIIDCPRLTILTHMCAIRALDIHQAPRLLSLPAMPLLEEISISRCPRLMSVLLRTNICRPLTSPLTPSDPNLATPPTPVYLGTGSRPFVRSPTMSSPRTPPHIIAPPLSRPLSRPLAPTPADPVFEHDEISDLSQDSDSDDLSDIERDFKPRPPPASPVNEMKPEDVSDGESIASVEF